MKAGINGWTVGEPIDVDGNDLLVYIEKVLANYLCSPLNDNIKRLLRRDIESILYRFGIKHYKEFIIGRNLAALTIRPSLRLEYEILERVNH